MRFKQNITPRVIAACIALLSLTACTTFDLGGIRYFSKVHPLKVDPATARVAIIWPEHISSPDVNIRFAVSQKEEVLKSGAFKLETISEFPDLPKKPSLRNMSDAAVYALKADQYDDAVEFRDWAADRIDNQDKRREKSTVSMGYFFSPTISSSDAEYICDKSEPVPFYVWVKENKASHYRRLVRTKNIDKFLNGYRESLCEGGKIKPSATEKSMAEK